MIQRWLPGALITLMGIWGCKFEPGFGNYPACDDSGGCLVPGCECLNGQVCVPPAGLELRCHELVCKVDEDCDDHNPCTLESCQLNTCLSLLVESNIPCEDGLFCTDGERCAQGQCQAGEPRNCADDNACTLDSCNEEHRRCQHTLQPNPGAEGPQGNANCANGVDDDCDGMIDLEDPDCSGCSPSAGCDDDNGCTLDSCQEGICVNEPVADGTFCQGTFCHDLHFKQHTCSAGLCTSYVILETCDDQNPCTHDTCDAPAGCVFTSEDGGACDDGNGCSMNDTCSQGECQGTGLDADGDGFVSSECGGPDCDDGNDTVHPGTDEAYDIGNCSDQRDNDCDWLIDSNDDGCGGPTFGWSQRFGSVADDEPRSIAAHHAGNLVITGTIHGLVDFGGGLVGNPASADIFLAAFTADSSLRWSSAIGGRSGDEGRGVAMNAAGVLAATGEFSGEVLFPDGNEHTSVGDLQPDIFLYYLDEAGTADWSRTYGDSQFDTARGVALDGSNNVYLTGDFEGDLELGTDSFTSDGATDVFVAGFNSDGLHQWAVHIANAGTARGKAVAVQEWGVCAAGDFEETLQVGSETLDSSGGLDAFVACFNAGGDLRWWKNLGSTADDHANDLAVDLSGNVHVTGSFRGSVDFGDALHVSAGAEDIFIASYTADGSPIRSHGFGSQESDSGMGVAVDGASNVYLTGYSDSGLDLGGGMLPAAGEQDIFVASFDQDGLHRWSRTCGGVHSDSGVDIALGDPHHVFVLGYFQGSVSFGGQLHESAGETDIFLLRIDQQ